MAHSHQKRYVNSDLKWTASTALRKLISPVFHIFKKGACSALDWKWKSGEYFCGCLLRKGFVCES